MATDLYCFGDLPLLLRVTWLPEAGRHALSAADGDARPSGAPILDACRPRFRLPASPVLQQSQMPHVPVHHVPEHSSLYLRGLVPAVTPFPAGHTCDASVMDSLLALLTMNSHQEIWRTGTEGEAV